MAGLRERFRRERKEQLDQAIREGEVGECTSCHNIFPWRRLTDFSTQERYEMLCDNCIARNDPRYRGKKA
jgi:hypothetical protein